jgi:photosystem II stability/assembly factor-like uncharacterized protein
MPDAPQTAFMSYSREDSEFALRLARDLRDAGASVWIDQLDIRPGAHWDNAIEDALLEAPQMLVVLSPASSRSPNVRNEISFALEQGKIVVPVIYKDCIVPLQLQRQNRIDFRADYARGLSALLDHLRITHPNQAVLDKATKEETVRKAAWQAREAEARRLADLRELEEEAARQRAAERVAIEDAEQKALGQTEQKTHEVAAAKAAEAGPSTPAENQHRIKGLALSFWKPWLLAAIGAVTCLVTVAYFFSHHWSSHAGARWTAINGGLASSLHAITGSSNAGILYACGSPSNPDDHFNALLFKSVDGGATWVRTSGLAYSFCSSLFTNSDGARIWEPGVDLQTLTSNDGGATFKVVDDGFSHPEGVPPPEARDGMISIFGTPDGRRLWQAGALVTVIESRDGGSTWVDLGSYGDDLLRAISGTNDGTFLIAVGEHGAIVTSDNGGADWQIRPSKTKSQLDSVFVAASARLLCTVGENGTILVSTDKGVTWAPRISGTKNSLYGVFGSSDGEHLWAVGAQGTIIESDDGGATWIPRPSGTQSGLDSIFGTPDGKHLWAVGGDGTHGTILESTSGFH